MDPARNFRDTDSGGEYADEIRDRIAVAGVWKRLRFPRRRSADRHRIRQVLKRARPLGRDSLRRSHLASNFGISQEGSSHRTPPRSEMKYSRRQVLRYAG